MRGISHKDECNALITEIIKLLQETKKPYKFLWRRRNHRYMEAADSLSKLYLLPKELTKHLYQIAPNYKKCNRIPLHESVRINPHVNDILGLLSSTATNFIFVPQRYATL